MKQLLITVGSVAALFILAVAVDQFTPLKQLTVYLDEHPQPYQGLAIGMSIFGWMLLIVVFAVGIWLRGRPMSEDAARQYMSTSAGQPKIRRKSRGKVAGREYRNAASFREVKDAVRTGSWVYDRGLWLILVGLIGLLFAVYGMFGYFVIIGRPLVKLVCAGALVYATARTIWGFWKA